MADLTQTGVTPLGLVWLCGRLPEEGKWVSLKEFLPHVQYAVGARLKPLLPEKPSGLRTIPDSTWDKASSILTPHKSCNLIPPMGGT